MLVPIRMGSNMAAVVYVVAVVEQSRDMYYLDNELISREIRTVIKAWLTLNLIAVMADIIRECALI